MTTSLILLLYLADVVAGVSVIATIGYLCVGICLLFSFITTWEMGDDMPTWHKNALMAIIGLATFSAILPSKSTIYASAAVYVAGEAANTEEFNLVRQMVTKELRQLVEKGKK